MVEVLEELDMTGLPVAGLAKEHEWLYLPNAPDPIVLPPNSPALRGCPAHPARGAIPRRRVSVASLVFPALLGTVGARAGGANVLRATVRVTFWGAFAMTLTAGIGAIVGKSI